jgi:hypothetical protein
MDNHKDVLLGKDAASILDNAAYQTAIKVLKESVVEQWKDCPIRDKEGQLLLLQLAKLTDKFESIFHGLIENGKFVAHKIELDRIRDESPIQLMSRKLRS